LEMYLEAKIVRNWRQWLIKIGDALWGPDGVGLVMCFTVVINQV
jgi:hypothetical protein